VMEAASRTWISSTLAGESVALAAAQAVLDRHDTEDVCAGLRAIGERQMEAVRRALAAADVPGVTLAGLPQMWFLRHQDPTAETRTLEAAVARGALLKRGAYQFASLAHDDASSTLLEEVLTAALVEAYHAR